jgi:ribosomal protein L29
MPFKKNESGNPAGRPKGATDKAKTEIREMYQQVIENNLSNVEIWLSNIAEDNPAKALDLMLRLSEFCLPKLKAMEIKADTNDQTIVVIPPNFTPEERELRINELKKKLFEED